MGRCRRRRGEDVREREGDATRWHAAGKAEEDKTWRSSPGRIAIEGVVVDSWGRKERKREKERRREREKAGRREEKWG